MLIRLWGVRGSIPAPLTSDDVRAKILEVLKRAKPEHLADEDSRARFVDGLPLSIAGTYGGNTACVELRFDEGGTERVLAIDAGTGLRGLGARLAGERGADGGEVDILYTHTHWDHMQGLPFFAPCYNPRSLVRLHSPARDFRARIEGQQLPQYFPITVAEYPARIELFQLEPDRTSTVAGLRVANMRMYHPNSSFSYAIERDGKKFVFCTDAEFFRKDENYVERALDFFRGADLLVMDTQYTANESMRKVEWGHSSMEMAIDMAVEAGVKRLVTFHHDPTYPDAVLETNFNAALQYQREHYPDVELILNLGYEGLEISL